MIRVKEISIQISQGCHLPSLDPASVLLDPVARRSERLVDTASLCWSAYEKGCWLRGGSLENLREVGGSPGRPVPVNSSYKSLR